MSIRKAKMQRRGFLLLALLTLGGCGIDANRKMAEEAVARFHAMLNDERYAEIYDEASKELRSKTKREPFIRYLSDIRKNYGLNTKARIESVEAFRADGFDYLTVECTTEFANGNLAERFAFKCLGDAVVLAGYTMRFQR